MYFGLFITIALGVAVGIWISKNPVRFFKALLAIILVVLEYVIFIAILVGVVFWIFDKINSKYSLMDLETLKYVAIIIIPMTLLFFVGCLIGARKNKMTISEYIEKKLGEREGVQSGFSLNKEAFTKYILKWLGLSLLFSAILFLALHLFGLLP